MFSIVELILGKSINALCLHRHRLSSPISLFYFVKMQKCTLHLCARPRDKISVLYMSYKGGAYIIEVINDACSRSDSRIRVEFMLFFF